MYDSGVKLLKGGRTRWIDHKLRAMGRSLEKFGLYVGHLKDLRLMQRILLPVQPCREN